MFFLVSLRSQDAGVTLVEQIAIAAVIGVISALGVPSMTTLYHNNQVKEATNQIHQTLMIAQRQAMTKSMNCALSFTQDANTQITKVTSIKPDCLGGTDPKLPKNVVVGGSLTSITFSFRGLPDKTGTIIVSMPSNPTILDVWS